MIELRNVSKYYSQDGKINQGIQKVNVTLELNEFIAIVGESGSGKSTFLNVVSGIDTYEEGEMLINGQETSYFEPIDFEKYRKENVGFIFQNYNLIDSYTVLQNVMIPLILKGYSQEDSKKRALELLERVGLGKRVNHHGTKLSGGEKQRTIIARALASDAKIIACDEPTGNLDKKSSLEIIKLLKEISKDRLVLIVTHNFDEVKDVATRKLRFFDGKLVEDTPLVQNIETNTSQVVENTDKEKVKKESNFKIISWIALKNLVNTPKRTFFTTIVFFTLCLSLLFSSTNLFNNQFSSPAIVGFNYLGEDRIIISKKDHSFYTDSEVKSITNQNNVKYVEQYDFFDETYLTIMFDEYSSSVTYRDYRYLEHEMLFSGRIPESDNEIVITNMYYFGSSAKDFLNTEIVIENRKYTVVGIVDEEYGNFVYGMDYLKSVAIACYLSRLYNSKEIERINFTIDNSIPIGQIHYTDSIDQDTILETPFEKISIGKMFVQKENLSDKYVCYLSSETAFGIFDKCYQMSVYLNFYAGYKKILSDLADYNIIHKSFSPISEDYIFEILLIVGKIIGAVALILTSTLMTYLILYFILVSKKKDFGILRTLGADNVIMRKVLLLENFIVATVCYIVSFVLLKVLGSIFKIDALEAFKHISFGVVLITIIIVSLVIILLTNIFNKRVFKTSVNSNLGKEQ